MNLKEYYLDNYNSTDLQKSTEKEKIEDCIEVFIDNEIELAYSLYGQCVADNVNWDKYYKMFNVDGSIDDFLDLVQPIGDLIYFDVKGIAK